MLLLISVRHAEWCNLWHSKFLYGAHLTKFEAFLLGVLRRVDATRDIICTEQSQYTHVISKHSFTPNPSAAVGNLGLGTRQSTVPRGKRPCNSMDEIVKSSQTVWS